MHADPANPIEDMPGHPEHVQPLADPAAESLFWDYAEELLDSGLADICEELGWMS